MMSKPDASFAATMERSMIFKGVVVAVYLGSNISLNMLNKVCLQQSSVMMRQGSIADSPAANGYTRPWMGPVSWYMVTINNGNIHNGVHAWAGMLRRFRTASVHTS